MIDKNETRFIEALKEAIEPFSVDLQHAVEFFDHAPVKLKSYIKLLKNNENNVFCIENDIVFDSIRKFVSCESNSQVIELTEKEAMLLKCIIGAKGEVSREDLLKTVWGYAENIDTHTLETHVHRLRLKLKQLPYDKEYIAKTPTGYKFK